MQPSRLSTVIKGDLDWIVLKAIEKDRARRYETVAALMSDLNRYLANEPIEARPASMLYRLQKSARRNKAAVISFAIISAVLVVGTAVSSWQAVRAWRAERESAKRLVQARRALDSMSSLAISELLSKQTEVTPAMRKLLRDALVMYEQFAAESGVDRETRAGVAAATARVGQDSTKARH